MTTLAQARYRGELDLSLGNAAARLRHSGATRIEAAKTRLADLLGLPRVLPGEWFL